MPPQLISALLQLLQNRIAGTASQGRTTGSASTVAPNDSLPFSGKNASSTSSTTSAAYSLNSSRASLAGQSYSAANTDESAV